MNKKVRKAVRCFIFKENEVVCIKYLKGKVGYYDIPGGKIEEGETPEETVYRECLEETGLKVSNVLYKGNIYVEYPNRSYILKTFVTTDYIGKTKNFEENISQWIRIEDLLLEKDRNSFTMLLEKEFIGCLLNKDKIFELYIKCDNEENVIEKKLKYI